MPKQTGFFRSAPLEKPNNRRTLRTASHTPSGPDPEPRRPPSSAERHPPSSIAWATSLAVPIPASTMIGYRGLPSLSMSTINRILCGLRIPWPLPIGLPGRHDRRRSRLLQTKRGYRIVVGIAEDLERLSDESLGRPEQFDGVRQQRLRISEHLQLDPIGSRIFEAAEDFGRAGRSAPRTPRRSSPRCSAIASAASCPSTPEYCVPDCRAGDRGGQRP